MIDFNDLQQLWNQQPGIKIPPGPEALIRLAAKNTRSVKTKHRWTIGILSVLVAFLGWYYGYAAGFALRWASAGLLLMIFSVVLRVILEYSSYTSFRKISAAESFKVYTAQVNRFYSWRKKIHYRLTPVILLSYLAGFIVLLPAFKKAVSAGFYTYILISGAMFFVVFTWFMVKQIKKELALLAFLKNIE